MGRNQIPYWSLLVSPKTLVLGPILFLAYINDLPNGISSHVRFFADDTALYLTIKGKEDSSAFQKDLDTLSIDVRI